MDAQPVNQTQLIVEIASHFIQIVGWPALVLFAWKARTWMTETENRYAEKFDKLLDNHMSHMQAAMEANADAMTAVAQELRELRNDIRLAPFKRD